MSKCWQTPASGLISETYRDILKQTHILIAGATRSGKSVIMNGLIYTTLFRTPNDCALILCDPKLVELYKYAQLPHVLRYAETTEQIADSLTFAADLTMQRFETMKKNGQVKSTEKDVYIFVDEFAALITKGPDAAENKVKNRVEIAIERIGRLGGAANVHLILATQSPDRTTIKAHIQQNMTARIALHCDSAIESRQIIGRPGAELLPQFGNCIYKKPGEIVLINNVLMVPDEEITDKINWWTKCNPVEVTIEQMAQIMEKRG